MKNLIELTNKIADRFDETVMVQYIKTTDEGLKYTVHINRVFYESFDSYEKCELYLNHMQDKPMEEYYENMIKFARIDLDSAKGDVSQYKTVLEDLEKRFEKHKIF